MQQTSLDPRRMAHRTRGGTRSKAYGAQNQGGHSISKKVKKASVKNNPDIACLQEDSRPDIAWILARRDPLVRSGVQDRGSWVQRSGVAPVLVRCQSRAKDCSAAQPTTGSHSVAEARSCWARREGPGGFRLMGAVSDRKWAMRCLILCMTVRALHGGPGPSAMQGAQITRWSTPLARHFSTRRGFALRLAGGKGGEEQEERPPRQRLRLAGQIEERVALDFIRRKQVRDHRVV